MEARTFRKNLVVGVLILLSATFFAAVVQGDVRDDICVETQTNHFGRSVSGDCDLNGDGTPDLIVGAPEFRCDGGRVYIFSGLDSHLVYLLYGEEEDDDFGFSVSCAGDVNNDNKDDFIVGAPGYDNNRGKVYVYSGTNFTILNTITGTNEGDKFGFSASGGAYINDDEYSDLLIGAPGADYVDKTDCGKVYLYLGNTWQQLWDDHGEESYDSLGYSVSLEGHDINGDDTADAIVAAPYYDGFHGPNNGRVYVLSGWSRELVCWCYGDESGDPNFGWSVAGLRDTDNDDRDEFVVGYPGFNSSQGTVGIYSYNSLIPDLKCQRDCRLFGWSTGDKFGSSVAAGGDANGDGIADLIIGSPGANNNKGRAEIYRADICDSRICYISGENEHDEFGYAVAWAGQINGDNNDDFVIGAKYAETSSPPILKGAGKAYVHSGSDCSKIREHTDDLPSIDVTSPSQGDCWQADCEYEILWDTSNASLAPYVRMKYSTNGGATWSEWIDSIPDTGSFLWYIPGNACSDSGNAMLVICTQEGYQCDTAASFSLYRWGDVDGSCEVNVGDLVYLVEYVFFGGWPPRPCVLAGDVDCSGGVNVTDPAYLIDCLFFGGACECCR